MAAKCPKCGGEIGASDKTCPSCGAAVRQRFGNRPASEKLKTVSSAVMLIGIALLMLEFLSETKTYVGPILLGVGFVINGLSQLKKAKEENSDNKRMPMIIIAIGILIMAAGVVFLIMDLG